MRAKCLTVVALLAALLFASCEKKDGFDKSELNVSDVCLKIDGEIAFSYQASSCQMAFNKGRKEFRAGLDNMSDYFSVKMSELPSSAGQTLTATVTWTTSDNVRYLQSQSFKVENIADDGTVWLWCPRQKALAVIKLLH